MDVFAVRDRVVDDYREFVQGFLRVRDRRIAGHVERAIAGGLLWPEPWLSLNPAFESGGDVEQLVAMDLLHPRVWRDLSDRGPHAAAAPPSAGGD